MTRAPRHDVRRNPSPAPEHVPGPAPVAGGVRPLPGRALTTLQRTAGNRAVAGLLQQVTVQRHSSWEHTLLGDTRRRSWAGRRSRTPRASTCSRPSGSG